MDGLELNARHLELQQEMEPFVITLLSNSSDADALKNINACNSKIVSFNEDHSFPLDIGILKIDEFINFIDQRSKALSRRKKHTAGSTLWQAEDKKLTAISVESTRWLRSKFLPETWRVFNPGSTADHEPSNQAVGPNNQSVLSNQQTSSSEEGISQMNTKTGVVKTLKSARRKGYVLHEGLTKKIECWIPVNGLGIQLLVSSTGKNDLTQLDIIAGSIHRKGYSKTKAEADGIQRLVCGDRESLRGKDLDSMEIAGVGAVNRDMRKTFCNFPKAIVWCKFANEDPVYYYRSVLGSEFGQKVIDEDIERYRCATGQSSLSAHIESRTMRRKASIEIISDDELEGSESLNGNDTASIASDEAIVDLQLEAFKEWVKLNPHVLRRGSISK